MRVAIAMNRYDWLLWGFRLFVDGDAFGVAKMIIKDLDNANWSNEEKREYVVDQMKKYLKRGGVYILRALVEVLLSQAREK